MITKLFYNASIYTPVDHGSPAAGLAQSEIKHFEHGAVLVKNGMIADIGEENKVISRTGSEKIHQKIDCKGRCFIPGFVDPHTHMCFARTREGEFEQRIQGIPYLEILKQGGGILSSVRAVAQADEDELFEVTIKNMLSALKTGTTTLEIKSGYGLDTENELKMLRVIKKVAEHTPLDVVPTFLGAHAVPLEYIDNPDAFVNLVVDEMLPAVKDQGIAEYCDVFCEQGVFSLSQSRKILKASQGLGLGIKIHADEVNDLGGGGLAAELGAVSADHLLAVSTENIDKMAKAGVIATLLPATAYSLRKPCARAKHMIERGLAVALATDCNPGSSYTWSMPFIFGLAVMNMGLSPAQALTASTLNSAYVLGMEKQAGSLDKGKQADFLMLEGKTPSILAYNAGGCPVKAVYKLGEPVSLN
ncbi:Imidazolonepropionase [Desulfonema limicola]|uniref:Imidazolonepropionase n=1 Tax=Desulfonema limicola TaxID=45656 RepID=A0A975GFK9_9BACT|nr:imidazolonepropionase [Desulfonema limicola]QTA79348.1 Imidazolonepropionase [Desulfonema limicola]